MRIIGIYDKSACPNNPKKDDCANAGVEKSVSMIPIVRVFLISEILS
jgi:hypothetical protein